MTNEQAIETSKALSGKICLIAELKTTGLDDDGAWIQELLKEIAVSILPSSIVVLEISTQAVTIQQNGNKTILSVIYKETPERWVLQFIDTLGGVCFTTEDPQNRLLKIEPLRDFNVGNHDFVTLNDNNMFNL